MKRRSYKCGREGGGGNRGRESLKGGEEGRRERGEKGRRKEGQERQKTEEQGDGRREKERELKRKRGVKKRQQWPGRR